MSEVQIEFEPTRSFGYRFTRYVVLPEVDKVVEKKGGEAFLLREIAWPIAYPKRIGHRHGGHGRVAEAPDVSRFNGPTRHKNNCRRGRVRCEI